MAIKFGPSGNSESFYAEGHKHTYEAMEWIAGMGLTAYEYSFGRGVRIGRSSAEKIAQSAERCGIAMSVHAPYYINLASSDEEKLKKNTEYFIESARAASWLGATRVIFHPGSCAKLERGYAFSLVRKNMGIILRALEKEGFGSLLFCPETMGKKNQIGDLSEVLTLCADYPQLMPAIDFAHLHARTGGGIKSQQDFADILDEMEARLGFRRIYKMHVHFSKIEWTSAGGEKQHRTFADEGFGPYFEHLAPELAQRRLCPTIICESKGTMGEDAAQMKRIYDLISLKRA